MRGLGRKNLRNSEIALILLAAGLGVAIGLGVVLVHQLLQKLHEASFALPAGRALSAGLFIPWWRALVIPAFGGLVVGGATLLIRRWRPREIVDAVEANALYGGKMSLTDSANLTLLTVLSGGFGASVGLEAAYTQLGAGFSSHVGKLLRARRNDLRTLVGCGAAAAIAAAFNAPLAGAFYAFELVIGSYSPAVLAPVGVAALAGTFTARWTFGSDPIFYVSAPLRIAGWDYALFAALGLAAAGLGVLTMLAVTWVEQAVRRGGVPVWLRPALGGAVVGLVAFFYPQVLGSGHGAIEQVIDHAYALPVLVGLVAAKALASAVSVGAGFRGGLFSSSLFLGALFGSVAGALVKGLLPGLGIDPLAYTLVGMSSVAAAIVGAPITMILLVLELTADFYVAVGVMVGVIVASIVVRLTFGYSFATWRFHLRGVPIRGGQDVGWIRDLTVGRLMRRDVHTAPEDLPLAEFRRRFPLGGPKRIFLVDANGQYAGLVATPDAHGADLDERLDSLTARDLRHGETQFLLPPQNVRTALARFVNAELETLPVLASASDRRVVGFLTEAYALRRYNQELERTRGDEIGDSSLFGAS
jgi:CIC family chloride channel protein